MKNIKSIIVSSVLACLASVGLATLVLSPQPVYAGPTTEVTCPDGTKIQMFDGATEAEIQVACASSSGDSEIDAIDTGDKKGTHQCGKGEGSEVFLGFNIGCRGETYPAERLNPIIDMLFAFFRFLSLGVGLVVIGSIIVAGIQYSTSRGNPQSTQAAIKRIVSSVGALFLYIFIYAIANFLIPGGMF